MTLALPSHVENALLALENSGFEAFVVGGCVRDMLMHKKPHDWDICTCASPDEIRRVFLGCRLLEIGARHGTIGVLCSHEGGSETALEITTYRTDGEYSNGRHPDNVRFTTSIEEDLARRDFTMNAIAYSPIHGLLDPFGGERDIERRLIRCCGNPHERFAEDALRILRCARFCAQLGFAIEDDTLAAGAELSQRVLRVSAERITDEFTKLLLAPAPQLALCGAAGLLCGLYPQLADSAASQQYRAICEKLGALPQSIVQRLAAFALALSFGSTAHIPQTLAEILAPLRLAGREARPARLLAEAMAQPLPDSPVQIKRLLRKFGPDTYLSALNLLCTVLGQRTEDMADECCRILERGECYQPSMLAVSGSSLLELGFKPGPALGAALETLLEQVISDRLPNERDALLRSADKLLRR